MAEPPRSSGAQSAVHALVSKALLALRQLTMLADHGASATQEAVALGELARSAVREAARLAGRPVDLLIGRTVVQLHGEALHAPSWVYDAAWALAARWAPGAICALFLSDSVRVTDLCDLAQGKPLAADAGARVFALPPLFAALVEAQAPSPQPAERRAILVVGVRRGLAAAAAGDAGSVVTWAGLARSVVEWCDEYPRWESSARSTTSREADTWLVADAATLAARMMLAAHGSLADAFDVALAALLIGARRTLPAPGSPGGDDLAAWALGCTGSDALPSSSIALLLQLGHVAQRGTMPEPAAAPALSLGAAITETAWTFVHKLAATQGDIVRCMNDALVHERQAQRDRDVFRLLVATTAALPSGAVVELADGTFARLEGPVVAGGIDETDAQTRDGRSLRVTLREAGERCIVGLAEDFPAATGLAPERADPAKAERGPSRRPAAPASNRPADARPFTDDELGSFLDEFLAWGGPKR